MPGPQGEEGEQGLYDPTMDKIFPGPDGPQGPIGKLTYL